MARVTELLTEGVDLTHAAIEADAETWVEAHRAPMPADSRDFDREWLRRLGAVEESNDVLGLHFRTLERVAAAAPTDAAVGDPTFPTSGAVARWCAYALPGIDERRRRLAAERRAILARRGWPG